jgi:hypothetical protein
MTGLDRLFADDTSIGHIANDKDSLQDMVNLDLAYLKVIPSRFFVNRCYTSVTGKTTNNTSGFSLHFF